MNPKEILKNICRPVYGPIMCRIRARKKDKFIRGEVSRISEILKKRKADAPYVFYLGITAHSNLGDMAQYYCIHNWIAENYSGHHKLEIEADPVVDTKYDLLSVLKKSYRQNDVIIFQSGYTTQDLGGVHDLMHRMVIEAIPEAKILMMPQTIFFKHPENERRSAEIYNSGKNMLFLARDHVSYKKALEMMPNIRVELYPDIVTSLIGKYRFKAPRRGVCLCRRNDGEKYYSEEDLDLLKSRLSEVTNVTVNDTTIKVPFKTVRANRKQFIEGQIEEFSKYEVVITDRYHGTILSLAAGTPVIIIKTNDHKVITGADWFKGIYDDYVYLAKDLDDAYEKACSIMNKPLDHILSPYFEEKYYKSLKAKFEADSTDATYC